MQVIVVDDASDRAEAVRGLEGPRVRVIRHDAARGVASARNTGARASTTPWVAFLDDDDRWAPYKLRDQLAAVTAARAGWGCSDAIVVTPEGGVIETHWAPSCATLSSALLTHNPIPAGASNVVARRELLEGGFDPALRHFADWDMWLRLAATAPFAPSHAIAVAYVRHDTAMQTAETASAMPELARFAAKVRATTGHTLDQTLAREWIAQGHSGARDHIAAVRGYAALGLQHPSRRFAREAARQLVLAATGAEPKPPPTSLGPDWAQGTGSGPPVD